MVLVMVLMVSLQDLHRTGSCRLLSPSDDRAALKRVLLAYARWNKEVGYCQVSSSRAASKVLSRVFKAEMLVTILQNKNIS